MTDDRPFLKHAIPRLLDTVAGEHSLGHQPSKAVRCIFTSRDGTLVEIMFQKDEGSPPNIWCHAGAAGEALIAPMSPRRSPASGLWTKRGKDGKPRYERHSALEDMPQLGDADLVRFTPENLAQVGQIIDRLRGVTASDLS